MATYIPAFIHPEMRDQNAYLIRLAFVDALADIMVDCAVHSTLSSDQKQKLTELMELLRVLAESEGQTASESDKLVILA